DELAYNTPMYRKPKRADHAQHQKIRNIQSNPHVSLLIDDYSENWNELGYIHVRATADIIEPDGSPASEHLRAVAALRLKYTQYHSMTIEQSPLIRILPSRVHVWSADGERKSV